MTQVKIFGLRLNPGPFSVKEHVLITVMASVGAGSAYAVSQSLRVASVYRTVLKHRILFCFFQTDIIAVQRVFYNQSWSFGYQWLVVMSTQLIGFSIGGIARRFLVAPPSMSASFFSAFI